MRDFFRKKTWFITALMFVIAFGLSFAIVYYEFVLSPNIKIIKADSSNNINGYAWSPNIGWVSFNCTNDDSCATSNYGVSLNSDTGYFSGYAWSPNIGWISFNETNPPDNYSFNTSCKTSGCNSSNNCTACYNSGSENVHGWAKILSLGDNGWIKFHDTWTNGVSIDSDTGSLIGWAWNGNSDDSGIGWLSFSCANDNSCATSDYKVIATISAAPTITDLTAPNWSFAQAAQYGALQAKLGWVFNDVDNGASESAYQIIVNNSNSIDNPLFNSGKCTGYKEPTGKCKIDVGVDRFPIDSVIDLDYNTPYYWWIKVWDNTDIASSLMQYNTDQDTPIEADDFSRLTFTTYKHEMPDVDFSWFPISPSKGEEVNFISDSQIYSTEHPDTAVDCTEDSCDWEWSATSGINIIAPTASSTIIKFDSTGSATITLKITDSDGYYTYVSKTINVNAELPKWKEVKSQ